MVSQEFLERTATIWGVSVSEVLSIINEQHPQIIRINTLKIRKSTISELKKLYHDITPLDWVKNVYFSYDYAIPPSTLEAFKDGQIILQNASSLLPVLALNPKPGQKILDMCAAPGSKSSYIAALANNKAELTLNDTSKTRFFTMKRLMENMGVQASYSLKDGRNLNTPTSKDVYDAILLDAPCSNEASILIKDTWSIATIKRLQSLQQKLITTAFSLLKPGGTLVYSTCTIAPEENELVVQYLLRHNPTASLLPIESYNAKLAPTLTKWNGINIDSRLSKAIRIMPYDIFKAFYIAKITKESSQLSDDDSYERAKKAFART